MTCSDEPMDPGQMAAYCHVCTGNYQPVTQHGATEISPATMSVLVKSDGSTVGRMICPGCVDRLA